MDRLDNLWTYATKRHVGWYLATFIAVLGVWGLASRNTLATPITLAFDAKITDASTMAPFSLPFSYQNGDIVHGTFTFDPAVSALVPTNGAIADESFTIAFNINGAVVTSSQYTIQAFDNAHVLDDGTADFMEVGCSGFNRFQACTPSLTTLPGGRPFALRAQIELSGPSTIFKTPIVSVDPAIWNAFTTSRELQLSFDGGVLGSMGLIADVGPIAVVQEPPSYALFLSMLFGIAFLRLTNAKYT